MTQAQKIGVFQQIRGGELSREQEQELVRLVTPHLCGDEDVWLMDYLVRNERKRQGITA